MRLGLGIDIPRLALSAGWSPLSLFAAGEQGVWYDPSDFSTMFQDSAGTTPVTAVEQPVGKILDKSGRGNHALQATTAQKPTLSARVNLLTYSEQFDNASWSKSASSASADAAVAPDGTTTADKLVESATTAAHYVVKGYTYSATRYVLSVSAKAAERNVIRIRRPVSGSDAQGAEFDLSTGVATVLGTVVSATMVDQGSGWWRCILVCDPPSGGASDFRISLYNGAVSYAGDGTSGVYLWGAQLEASATVTTYQRVTTATDYDTVGFLHYLRFDGVDDGLATAAIDFTATDKMTVCAGVRKLSDAARGMLYELSADINTNNGTFALEAPDAAAAATYRPRSKGTVIATLSVAGYVSPVSSVLTQTTDIAADAVALRVNGGAATSSATDQGTGNYGNYPLYIGRRGGTSLSFNGRIYQLVVRGAATADLTSVENYVNGKTGAY